MRAVEVLAPGSFTTIQDLGRPGYGPLGVSACGAADAVSLRIGNRLVGNPEGAPALEQTLKGGVFRFPDGATVALAGAPAAGVAMWTTLELEPGAALAVGVIDSGLRTYLCIAGGIDVPLVLGSASTHLPSGIGGQPLRRGDSLRIRDAQKPPAMRRVNSALLSRLGSRRTLRVTPGPQADWCAPDALTRNALSVRPDSNRTGLRLSAANPVIASNAAQMTTEGVSLGAIQAPPGGDPIILFVDAQTTGGYPVIANVISADLPSVGQLRPGDAVRFEFVSFEEARRLLFGQEDLLASGELLW